MNKIIACIFFTIIIFSTFSQNKKEQIEELNYSIDSLNNVVSNERINIQNKTKEIEAFSKKDLSNQIEISMLKSEFNEANLKIPSLDSVTFFNFSNLLSVVEMDKLYKCLPPSLIKAEFYKNYKYHSKYFNLFKARFFTWLVGPKIV
jgi:hypothetical protein